jgi:hypothetical protein
MFVLQTLPGLICTGGWNKKDKKTKAKSKSHQVSKFQKLPVGTTVQLYYSYIYRQTTAYTAVHILNKK